MVSLPEYGHQAAKETRINGQSKYIGVEKHLHSHSVHVPGCTIPLCKVSHDQKKLAGDTIRRRHTAGIADLNASLTDMNRDNFTHCV